MEPSYYQKEYSSKWNTHIIKRNTHQNGTLILSKGILAKKLSQWIGSGRASASSCEMERIANTHHGMGTLISKALSATWDIPIKEPSICNHRTSWRALDPHSMTCWKPLKLFLPTSTRLFLWLKDHPHSKNWTLDFAPAFLSGFTPPWAHDRIFLLVSGKTTWLPVAWARDPFFQLVSGFEPAIPLATHGQRLHFRLATTRTNQKPVWEPSEPPLLLRSSKIGFKKTGLFSFLVLKNNTASRSKRRWCF